MKRMFAALVDIATGIADVLDAQQARSHTAPTEPRPVAGRTESPVAPERGGGVAHVVAQSPFSAPETTVLRTPMDAANCGEYAFSLYNAQLIVSMLGTGGGVGGEYDVSRMPVQAWTVLQGRDGTALPVLVLRDHGALSVQVGSVAETPSHVAIATR